jgi:hypothetical protein
MIVRSHFETGLISGGLKIRYTHGLESWDTLLQFQYGQGQGEGLIWYCREDEATRVPLAREGIVVGGPTFPGEGRVPLLRLLVETKHQAFCWVSI